MAEILTNTKKFNNVLEFTVNTYDFLSKIFAYFK